jgi:hypothetical protein
LGRGWDKGRVRFIFGIDATDKLYEIAENLPLEAWKVLAHRVKHQVKTEPRRRPENVEQQVVEERGYEDIRTVQEYVAEFTYQPGKCQTAYRVVVAWKELEVRQGQGELFEKDRCFFCITNIVDQPAEEIVYGAHDRCNQENLHAQLREFHGKRSHPWRANRLKAEFHPKDIGDWFYNRISDWSKSLPNGSACVHVFRKTSLQYARAGEDVNFIHRFVKVFRDVELVEDHLLLGLGQMGANRLLIGRPHVQRHSLDPPQLLLCQRRPKAVQARLLAVLRHVQDSTSRLVLDHRHVLVPLAMRSSGVP